MGERAVDRLGRARALLRQEGLDADVSTAGQGAEILVVHARSEERARVARVAPAMRDLGFCYVTIELMHDCR
jgi:hypothetical protein